MQQNFTVVAMVKRKMLEKYGKFIFPACGIQQMSKNSKMDQVPLIFISYQTTNENNLELISF